jgi:hypothetical protein
MQPALELSPDLIPHDEFHKALWFKPQNQIGWYYFRKNFNGHQIFNPDFLTSVDAPLKDLVRFLHDNNIRTSPSCSGHSMEKWQIRKIYDGLTRDEIEITTSGLLLEEVQSGRVFNYFNKNYSLPWAYPVFQEKLEDYQHKGVLGIHISDFPQLQSTPDVLNIPGVRIKYSDGLVLILTDPKNESDISKLWSNITAEIRAIFGSGQSIPSA